MAQPNLYVLKGTHAKVTYSTTSIQGQPQFSYNDGQHNVTLTGTDIHSLDSEIGTQVTVLIGVTALNNTRLTLLIPHINLKQNETKALVKTIAILTTHQTEGSPSVQDSYQVLKLPGTASIVEF